MTVVTERDLAATSIRRAASARSTPATPGAVVLRGWHATRSTNWIVVLTGFFEPVFYLLSLGIGLGALIGTVTTSSGQRDPVRGVHRARAARGLGDERRDLRLHLERLLQDELRQALRGHAVDLARPARRRARRDPPRAAARRRSTPSGS